jgi:hypothetical protein
VRRAALRRLRNDVGGKQTVNAADEKEHSKTGAHDCRAPMRVLLPKSQKAARISSSLRAVAAVRLCVVSRIAPPAPKVHETL